MRISAMKSKIELSFNSSFSQASEPEPPPPAVGRPGSVVLVSACLLLPSTVLLLLCACMLPFAFAVSNCEQTTLHFRV